MTDNPPKPKILLIDDDEMVRVMYKEKFANQNFLISVLESIEGNIVEKVVSATPDLILLDIEYTNGPHNGFEAARLLKMDPRTERIPIVLLTNFSRREDAEKATALGMLDYVLKSNVTPHELVERVAADFARFKGKA